VIIYTTFSACFRSGHHHFPVPESKYVTTPVLTTCSPAIPTESADHGEHQHQRHEQEGEKKSVRRGRGHGGREEGGSEGGREGGREAESVTQL
jgi:hypothetical protein